MFLLRGFGVILMNAFEQFTHGKSCTRNIHICHLELNRRKCVRRIQLLENRDYIPTGIRMKHFHSILKWVILKLTLSRLNGAVCVIIATSQYLYNNTSRYVFNINLIFMPKPIPHAYIDVAIQQPKYTHSHTYRHHSHHTASSRLQFITHFHDKFMRYTTNGNA